MGIFESLRRTMRSIFGKSSSFTLPGEGDLPATRDTLSVIHDLSRAVRNNPEAVDIYMALGNLFRSKGDIQHAVLIRERLMARPELDIAFKARASFELGQDYRRAGVVDRALVAYRESARLGYSAGAVALELAGLFAESGSFEKAAEEYGKLGHYIGEAHYHVRHAEELAMAGQGARAAKVLKKATKVYSGSVEAWSSALGMHARAGEWRKAASLLKQALGRVEPNMRFLLFEALYQAIPNHEVSTAPVPASVSQPSDLGAPAAPDAETMPDVKTRLSVPSAEVSGVADAADYNEFLNVPPDIDIPDSFTLAQDFLNQKADADNMDGASAGNTSDAPDEQTATAAQTADALVATSVQTPPHAAVDSMFANALGKAIIPVLEKQEPGILSHYYGGLLLRAMGDTKNAAIWFSRALVVQPRFWAARLELLCLSAQDAELSQAVALQLEFLAEELTHIKRFYCTACGLRQENVFYRCPRCGSWHSISYRLSLQD